MNEERRTGSGRPALETDERRASSAGGGSLSGLLIGSGTGR